MTISRDDTRELEAFYDVTGAKRVRATHLTCAPPWILQEHESDWSDAYIEVKARQVPRDANAICSHVVYRVKRTKKDCVR